MAPGRDTGAAGLTLASALEAHAFLRGVPGDLVRRIATIAHEVSLPAGAFVIREGDDADRLYLIRAGAAALEVTMPGKPVVRLETLGPDDILGLSWMNPPHRWQFDARVVEPVTAIAIEAGPLRDWIRDDPRMGQAVAMRLVSQLQRRLERVRLQRLDVYGAEA
ncbi:MAG: cyclic nucleotide-binding domain-containing protein [Vicinamibacterales bacterium]